MFLQTWSLLNLVRCSTFLKIMKQWSRWSWRAEVQQWDTYPEPTELRLIGYLTESTWTQRSKSNMSTPKTNSQTHWLRTVSHVEPSSPFVQHQHFHLSKMLRNDVEKDAGRKRRRNNCGKVEADVQHGLPFCGKLPYSTEFECIKSPGDTQSTQSARFESHITMCRETCRWRFVQIKNYAASSSQVWLTDAKLTDRATKLAAAGTNQDQQEERARKLAAENSDFNDEDDSYWPHNYRISRANVPHFEKVHSNLRQQLKRKPEDQMQDLGVNTLIWECLWLSLIKPQFILETIVWIIYIQPRVSHKEQWNNCFDVTRKLVNEQQFSCQQRSLCIFRFSIEHGKNQWKISWRLVYEFTPMSRIGSNRSRADGVRVETFPRIHYIADSRRDPEHDDWNTMCTWAIPRTDHLHVNLSRHCMG